MVVRFQGAWSANRLADILSQMELASPHATQCDYCHLPIRAVATAGQPLYCCFGCSFAARVTHQRGDRGEVVWMLTRLGVAGFLSMAVMMFSIYLYGREIYETDATSPPLSAHLAEFFRFASLLCATPVLFLLGVPILQNAVAQWRSRIISTDALVVLGVASAFVYSYVATLRDEGHTYFETACMILVLVTLGRWFEAVGKLHATERVQSLESLLPDDVRVRRADGEAIIRREQLVMDDLLLIRAGERIPVDGEIETGRAHVDEQLVSGESLPVVRQMGDTVRAGTMNLDGDLAVRARAVGSETTLARLTALLEAARASKGRYERTADRVAALFLPVTIVLAAIAAAWGFSRAGVDEAIMSALSVLLIACPCGLGIATPMAVWVALGRGASFGALFRSGESIERLARVQTICFDKTGTLTTGCPRVASFTPFAGSEADNTLATAAALATSSTHAASRSIHEYARDRQLIPVALTDARTVPGRGITGMRLDTRIFLGNVAMMREAGMVFPADLQHAVDTAMEAGRGITCIGWDDMVRGVFSLDEDLRPSAKLAIQTLRNMGCRIAVLTGDHARRGEVIAKRLAVKTHAELRPEDKVRHIQAERAAGRYTAFVGDGLNDAPAMAAADIGIAMGCGADITREAAAICLLGDDQATLPPLLSLARRTVRTIRVNLFWVFFYNAFGLALAVSGRLSPVVAAIAMVASSLFVVGNSLRLNQDDSFALPGNPAPLPATGGTLA